MLITTKGVVIRERRSRENDKFIDVLTPDYGIIEISAKGAQKVGGKNNASTQLFAYSIFCVQQRGERYYLNSSEPIHIFYPIRTDIQKTALASYFSEIIKYAILSEQPSSEILRLLLNSFHFLSDGTKELPFLKSVFELRLMADIGMMPDIIGCKECRKYDSDKMFFCIGEGKLLCGDCLKQGASENIVYINGTLLHTIRYIVLSELEQLWNFKISDVCQKALSSITENYLLTHLGNHFQTLDFYKSL